MMVLDELCVLTEQLYEGYEVYTKFKFENNRLVVVIDTLNGLHFEYTCENYREYNDIDLHDWIQRVPNVFREDLADIALGKKYGSAVK
jgi:hypothetical protein